MTKSLTSNIRWTDYDTLDSPIDVTPINQASASSHSLSLITDPKKMYAPALDNLAQRERPIFARVHEEHIRSAMKKATQYGATPNTVYMNPESVKAVQWQLEEKPWKDDTLLDIALQEIEQGCDIHQAFQQAEKRLEGLAKDLIWTQNIG